ncbi:TPA: hypothetical protein EYP66_08285 [Candidatus Poribacteria bacterium]|nr:hypothetical protein [Candidatus Poribacteria bacterium]
MLYQQTGKKPENELFGIYLPEQGWKTLIVHLYMLEKSSEHFRLIYPSSSERRCRIKKFPTETKVWEIIYPKDLAENPKYLATEFKDLTLYQSWMLGRHK